MTDLLTRRHMLRGAAAMVTSRFILVPADAAPHGGQPRDITAAPAGPTLVPPPGRGADALAYDGQAPGPLLRVRRGEDLSIRLHNNLPAATSLHWHGMRIANALDGTAGLTGAAVRPGDSPLLRFTPPDPGLYWYHPCLPETADDQCGRGLFGAVIVDEAAPPEVDLDLLLVLKDWPVDTGGRTGTSPPAHDVLTINGKLPPQAPAMLPPGARIRLRLLNASVGRIATVDLGGLAARIVAVDGQPCELLPVSRGALPIGPGARFELLADLPDAADRAIRLTEGAGAGARDIATFRTTAGRHRAPNPMAALPVNPNLPTRIALERAERATLTLATAPALTPHLPARPLFAVQRDRPVALTVRNTTAHVQQIRLHGHVFRVLHDLDDGWDPYWRDSLLVGPGRTKHIAFIADNRGRWLIEAARINDPLANLPVWFEVN